MNLYGRISRGEEKIAIIGLGYVGLPLAISFARKAKTVGFDISEEKIESYKLGIDSTREVGNEEVKKSSMLFTTDENELQKCKFFIVAVPTPIKIDKTPNLYPIESASVIVGRNLSKGSIVVYESTVYPGVTEEICLPILERESGLICGIDFKIGYSPERINPGDKVHRLENIVKIVSGMDIETLDIVAKVYELVIDAGVYRAESIKVAEAAKVIENSQRDINIAFMNELSIIFNLMGIDTQQVLNAASTKWNFLKFIPGLVGGHCIGVDPYYLTYKAEQLGYSSQVILSGRRINDEMGKYIAENTVKMLVKSRINIIDAKVAILGLTFKENCPDTRNTKVIDIYNELMQFGICPVVVDPVADAAETLKQYNIELTSKDKLVNLDTLIVAVSHTEFVHLKTLEICDMFRFPRTGIIVDVKGIFNRSIFENLGYIYWRM